MFRKACLIAFAGLTASTALACSSGDLAVGTSQAQQELKKKKNGGATGNGQTCSFDGIDWGGGTASPPNTGGSTSPGSGTSSPPSAGTDPNTPVSSNDPGAAAPEPNGPVDYPNDTTTDDKGVYAQPAGGYPVGAVFPSPDGCHTCKCAPDGIWCTVGACTGGGTGGGNGGNGGTGCNVDGKIYPPGASVPSPDGCNTCGCGPDGQVACTAMACAPTTCVYNGKTYTKGESFPSADGCNTCGCMDDGNVACTEMACAN